MVKITVKLLAGIVLISLCIWVFSVNSAKITVSIMPGMETTANTGVILIGVFVLGVICASIVAGYYSIKASLRERRLRKINQQRESLYQAILEARSFRSTGEWEKAKNLWYKILKRDTDNPIGRIELAQTLEEAGEIREALKVIDAARAADPTNIEVLFQATKLNLLLNNKTAALDNLALILYNHPNKRAAVLARELSEDIGRIEDALEYQEQVEELIGYTDDSIAAVARLKFKKLLGEFDTEDPDQKGTLIRELKRFIKQNPDFTPALIHLSNLLAENGEVLDAADLLERAIKQSGSAPSIQALAKILISCNMPERAIAKTKTAIKNLSGEPRLKAELELIRIYISLNMLEEAFSHIEDSSKLALQQDTEMTSEIERGLMALSGLCLSRMGKHKEAAEYWNKFDKYSLELSDTTPRQETSPLLAGNAPSPRLSIP